MELIKKNFNKFEVRIIVINDIEYFIAKDIATILEYKETAKAVRTHCKKVFVFGDFERVSKNIFQLDPQTRLIQENDVLLLISKSQNKSEKEKHEILKSLGLSKKIILNSRDEINFSYSLKEALAPFNLEVKIKFKVDKYIVDFYISSKNLVIEYDENNHIGYSKEQEKQREKIIKDKLKCKILRLSNLNSDCLNIGLVFKEILK